MGTCRRIELRNMMSPLGLFFFVWMDYDFACHCGHEVCMRGCALTWGGVRRAGTWPHTVGETGTWEAWVSNIGGRGGSYWGEGVKLEHGKAKKSWEACRGKWDLG